MQIVSIERNIEFAKKAEKDKKTFEAIAFYKEAHCFALSGVLKSWLKAKIKELGGEI